MIFLSMKINKLHEQKYRDRYIDNNIISDSKILLFDVDQNLYLPYLVNKLSKHQNSKRSRYSDQFLIRIYEQKLQTKFIKK